VQREAFRQFIALERDHWWFRGRRTVYLDLVARALGGRRPRRALDLGCGVGGFLAGLAELSECVIGFEFDAEAAQHCRSRGVGPIARSSAERVPARDASFDLVCLFDVVEHLDDDAAALREAARVLAPGGLCVVSVPAYPFLFAENDRIAEHRRRYTRSGLVSRFRDAGFEIERATYTNVLLAPAIVPTVLALKAWERCAPRRAASAGHTNLSWRMPRFLDGVLYRCFAAELAFTRRRDAPFGHSLLAIGRKR
jgi:SAM-dependent methyltransferase